MYINIYVHRSYTAKLSKYFVDVILNKLLVVKSVKNKKKFFYYTFPYSFFNVDPSFSIV